MFAVLLAILNLLRPTPSILQKAPEQGDIAEDDVIAPFTFFIQKPEEELQKERQAAADAVPTVVDFDRERTEKVLSEFKAFLARVHFIAIQRKSIQAKIEEISSINPGVSAETILDLLRNRDNVYRDAMISALGEILDMGVIADKADLTSAAHGRLMIVENGDETLRGLESTLDSTEARNLVKELATQTEGTDERRTRSFVETVMSFVVPNLSENVSETQSRKQKAVSDISPVKGVVLKGEMIVRAHDVVTNDVVEKLRSLGITKGDMVAPSRTLISALGQNLLYCIVLGVLAAFLFFFRGDFFKNYSVLVLIAVIFTVTMAFSAVVLRLNIGSMYLVPVAAASMLTCMLLGAGVGTAVTLAVAVLVAVFTGLRVPGMLVALFGGLAGVYSVRGIKRRHEFYRAVIIVSLANVICIVGIELYRLTPFPDILRLSGFGVLNAFACTFGVVGLLPLCEHAFGLTTNIRLLELADLNRPLLKELAIKAPGTFHHSMVTSNLAQAAAEAVGANPLLARVGAWYHDIGKMAKPNYFIENQVGGKNPHDELSPKISSLVVAAHIKDGVELARKADLPTDIVDILEQHHGTALMVQFYDKFQTLHPDEEVSDANFRYPGPKPRSKEAAIVMLADSVEARARSLDSPTPSRLKAVIKEMVDAKLKEGQLGESELTMNDLQRITESFLPVLIGCFHPRVEYPSAEREKNGNLRGRSPARVRSEAGRRKSSSEARPSQRKS
jgi:hypothetical protein